MVKENSDGRGQMQQALHVSIPCTNTLSIPIYVLSCDASCRIVTNKYNLNILYVFSGNKVNLNQLNKKIVSE